MLKKTIEKLFGNFPARKLFSLTFGLTALLATVAGATPGYASSANEKNDWLQLSLNPGVQAAIDAGLVTELNQTARPVIDEANLIDPLGAVPDEYKITELNLSQSIDDVTVTLDWIYKDLSSATLMLTHSELPASARLGMPKFSYARVYEYEGIIFPDNDIMRVIGNQILAISYQVANPNNPEGTTDITIDIPLISETDPTAEPLAVFHYELNDYRVAMGQGLRYEFRQTSSVSYDNYEVQMRLVRALPETTEVVICYGTPAGGSSPLPLKTAALEAPANSGNEIELAEIAFLPDGAGLMDQCARVTFPYGNTDGDELLHFAIRSFGGEENADQTLNGDWSFYTYLPGDVILRSQEFEQELASATAQPAVNPDAVEMTIDWAYLDETRLDFGFHLTGLPYTPEADLLGGKVTILNSAGDPLAPWGGGHSTLNWSDTENGPIAGYWQMRFENDPPTTEDLPLTLQITLDGRPNFESAYPSSIGYFIAPQRKEEAAPAFEQITIPDQYLGVFDFALELPFYTTSATELSAVSEVNGIRMRLIGIESTPVGSDITLCYQKPSPADWHISYGEDNVELKIETGSADISVSTLLHDQDYGLTFSEVNENLKLPLVPESDERCVQVHFDLGLTDAMQKIELKIPQFRQSLPEVIPQEELDAIREPLKELGIEFIQVHGNGFAGFEITTPDGMDRMEGLEEVHRLLGYIYDGPWLFEFELP